MRDSAPEDRVAAGAAAATTQGAAQGFVPWSFTAVSTTHWWVLGGIPCGSRECPAIETTVDGGATFSRLPAPGGPFGPGLNTPPAAGNIRFADPEDGWVFGPRLYATHDGGRHWDAVPMPGQVTDLEPGLADVFAMVTLPPPPCAAHGTCTHSADGGARFAVEPQAIPGIACSYSPASDRYADCASDVTRAWSVA
jgi:hypothetical protein